MKISQNFVAFSGYMNFTYISSRSMAGMSEAERISYYKSPPNLQTLQHPRMGDISKFKQLFWTVHNSFVSQTLVYLSWASVSCNKSSRQTCRLPASTAAKRGIFPSWKEKSKNKNEKDNLITKNRVVIIS